VWLIYFIDNIQTKKNHILEKHFFILAISTPNKLCSQTDTDNFQNHAQATQLSELLVIDGFKV